jgi:UDPglucose 6-dehydrogenase
MKIGIIGKGFVGSAVQHGFSSDDIFKNKIKIYDKKPGLSKNSLEETVNDSDIVFLSVPTPSNIDGSINLEVIDSILNEINCCYNGNSIILIRSTLIPGTSKKFSEKYPSLKIVFNPEFLTERNANLDFINQSRIILGGIKNLTSKVAQLYKLRFGSEIPIIETNFETAEMIKYMNNCFLATKVSFMNEMKLLANKSNVDWDIAVDGFALDPRVGSSHLSVPGIDGKLGFGGSCFPKDLEALMCYAKSLGLDMHTLSGAWETNLQLRPETEWEQLEGRAVIAKKN